MPEREVNVFKKFAQNHSPSSSANVSPDNSAVRDYTEKPNIITQGNPSPEALERIKRAERGELKAKLASILDRGIVEDRLKVDLPSDLHGEWVRNDPLEINRLKLLGFKVDEEYATKRSIHSDGSDSAVVGDVVHVVCPKEIKEVINEIREEQILRQHAKKKVKDGEVNKEESEFLQDVAKEGDKNVVAFSRSSEHNVTRENLEDIMKSIDNQVTPSNR